MSKFATAFNPAKKEASPAGEHIQMEHRLNITTQGKEELIWDKPVDIYSKIQEGKEETEIEFILRRAREGDIDIMSTVQGSYIDVTDQPKTLAKLQQLNIDMANNFMKLPWQIRKEYDNDPNKYILDYGSEHWADIMGIKAKKEKEKAIAAAEAKEQEMIKKAIENLANGSAKEETVNE